MNLETAQRHFRACRELMDTLYQKPVFDEWAVVSFGKAKPEILSYDGSRPEEFVSHFHADSGPLLAEMQGRSYAIGDFEFAPDAHGSRYDACVRLGESTYLLCNYVAGSMKDIRGDARWLKAQAPFVNLTEKFRSDPLI